MLKDKEVASFHQNGGRTRPSLQILLDLEARSKPILGLISMMTTIFRLGTSCLATVPKRRQVPLVYSDDLTCMYDKCKRTKHVVLWVKSLRKRDLSLGAASSSARKRSGCDSQNGDYSLIVTSRMLAAPVPPILVFITK